MLPRFSRLSVDAFLPKPLVGGFVAGGLSGDGPEIDVGVACEDDEAEVVGGAWFEARLDRKIPPEPLSREPGDAEADTERFLVCVDGIDWLTRVGFC
jgi:hypothetical protein